MFYKEIANLLTIQGGGIPLTRSSRRLVANETKNYPFEGSPSPLQTGGIPSKKSSCRLVDKELFLTS